MRLVETGTSFGLCSQLSTSTPQSAAVNTTAVQQPAPPWYGRKGHKGPFLDRHKG
jgi:hypothetical protein